MAARKFKFVSPGVFLKEIDNSQLPREPGAVGPVIIGRTRKGPSMKPVKVRSFLDFQEIFGSTVPGNESEDPWRNPGVLATAYAPYAAQAYLKSQSPVTVIRLAGVMGDDASETGEPGWDVNHPHGIFLFPETPPMVAASGTLNIGGNANTNVTNDQTLILQSPGLTPHTFTFKAAGSTTTTATEIKNVQGNSADLATEIVKAISLATAAGSINMTAVRGNRIGASDNRLITLTQTVRGLAGNTAIAGTFAGGSIFINAPEATANAHGAHQRFVGGTDVSHLTGTLAGIVYATTGSVTGHGSSAPGFQLGFKGTALSGTVTNLVTTGSDRGTLIAPDSGGTYNLILSSSTEGQEERKVTFTEGPNFIRDVLNTSPVRTNDFISNQISGTLSHLYWLGETFEEEYSKLSAAAAGKTIYAAAIGLHPDMGDFKSSKHEMQAARTGWVFGQHTEASASYAPKNREKLFRVLALHEGEEASRNLIVQIENIRIPDDGDLNPYGTFSVAVYMITPSRKQIIERFDRCNLNPNSQDFIAKKIGDQYFKWDSAEKRNKIYGSNPNNSRYIRIETHSDISETGPSNNATVPFGFFGPVIPKSINNLAKFGDIADPVGDAGGVKRSMLHIAGTASATGAHWITGSFSVGGRGGIDTPGHGASIQLNFPASPTVVVISGSQPDMVFGSSPYKMESVSKEESSQINRGWLDYNRRLSTWQVSEGDQTSGLADDSTTQYAYIFSLDELVINGKTTPGSDLSAYTPQEVKFTQGSHLDSTAYTATSAGSARALTRDLVDSFRLPLAGGFDGVDITEADPFNMRVVSSDATTANSYAFASIDRAIDLIRDAEAIEMNLASMPGITNESLTTKLVETCEARADALAVIDLPDVYKEPWQQKCDNFEQRINAQTPSQVAAALTKRQLNSSYGATYYPWVKIRDTINTRDVWVPPSVVALGVMAYTEKQKAVWFAPAGFNRGGLNEGNAGVPVLQVTSQLLSKQRDILYEANINPIASFVTEGLVVFGQKTLQTTPSALDRINVRRLLIFIKRQISIISSRLLFDQNLPATWNRFKSQVEPFLEEVKVQLGLSDFKVILDSTTTTPDLVDRNIMYAKIFLKPARAIEFIAVDFVITNTGAAFDDP